MSPGRIGTDGAGTYPDAIAAARKEGRLARDPVHHIQKHQWIESAHFRLKKNMPRVGGFQSFHTARQSIQGFDAMLWLQKRFGFAGAWTVCQIAWNRDPCFAPNTDPSDVRSGLIHVGA